MSRASPAAPARETCSQGSPCFKPKDPTRKDGRCKPHGLLHDYRETGDRRVLPNRGLCHGDAVGYLCFGSHHQECPKWRPPMPKPEVRARPSRHELALGGAPDAA